MSYQTQIGEMEDLEVREGKIPPVIIFNQEGVIV